VATPEPPNQQSGPHDQPPSRTPGPDNAPEQVDQPKQSIAEQLGGLIPNEPPAARSEEPPSDPAEVPADRTQSIPPPVAPPPTSAPPAPPAVGARPAYPPLPSATTSQPMRPVPPPGTWPPQPYPGVPRRPPTQGGPTASYPGMRPVPRQPLQHTMPPGMIPAVPPAVAGRRSANPISGVDVVAGILLVVAAGLAVGGSFWNLDHAVYRNFDVNNGPLGVISTVDTSPWYYRSDLLAHPDFSSHLSQFFGVGLVVGAVLALTTAVLLLAGLGRRWPGVRGWGLAGAALLFGALLTTEMSVLNDLQWDGQGPPGSHSTSLGLGFWVLLGAGVATVGVAVLLLFGRGRGRVEPATPRYGVPTPPRQPVYHAPSQQQGGEHVRGPSARPGK
jgi:hypothetical protein